MITLIFLVLKLFGMSWSWWWVLLTIVCDLILDAAAAGEVASDVLFWMGDD